jgi:hypothetical protein
VPLAFSSACSSGGTNLVEDSRLGIEPIGEAEAALRGVLMRIE